MNDDCLATAVDVMNPGLEQFHSTVRGPDRHMILGIADELGRVGTPSAPSRITVRRRKPATA